MESPDTTETVEERVGEAPEFADLRGRYTVLAQVGRGGIGTVYRGYDETLDREVALKVMRLLHAGHVARLLREAQAMAQLSHPNVVHVYDVRTSGELSVIIMELVDGQTVQRWLRDKPDAAEVRRVFAGAGRGLRAAHEAGLVHLDFKPANVLLAADGTVKVTDFGLSRSADFSPRRRSSGRAALSGGVASWRVEETEHGVVAGTPRYMAPEQHRGQTCGPSSDVFAFCVAVWEALGDAPPYPQQDVGELAEAKGRGPPPWSGPPISRELETALRRGLDPDPARRDGSLTNVLDALLVQRRPARRRPLMWLGGAVVTGGVVVAVSLAGGAARSGGPGLEGYGTHGTFGRGGSSCVVSSLEDSGDGTLRDCIARHHEADAPMTIEFSVGGTIVLQSDLELTRPHLSIDGLSAPAPGVTLASTGIGTEGEFVIGDDEVAGTCAHDVLVQGIRLLGSWDGRGSPGQVSTLEITARRVPNCMRNIVLNRITFLAVPDAAGDILGDVADVTVQYSAFLRSNHPMELTNRPGEPQLHERISLHHNVFAYFMERSPQIRGLVRDVDITQNVFMNWKAYTWDAGYAIRVRCRDERCPQAINIEHNRWLSGSGADQVALVFGQRPDLDEDDGPIAAQIYLEGNAIPAGNPNIGLAPLRFVRPPQAAVTIVPSDAIPTDVLPFVGAPHRTDVERAIFAEVAEKITAELAAESASRPGA